MKTWNELIKEHIKNIAEGIRSGKLKGGANIVLPRDVDYKDAFVEDIKYESWHCELCGSKKSLMRMDRSDGATTCKECGIVFICNDGELIEDLDNLTVKNINNIRKNNYYEKLSKFRMLLILNRMKQTIKFNLNFNIKNKDHWKDVKFPKVNAKFDEIQVKEFVTNKEETDV